MRTVERLLPQLHEHSEVGKGRFDRAKVAVQYSACGDTACVVLCYVQLFKKVTFILK